MTHRLTALQQKLSSTQALLLSAPADVTYYTTFAFLVPAEREALLVLTQHSAHLLYANFSPVAKRSDIEYHAGCFPQHLQEVVQRLCDREHIKTLQFDRDTLFVAEYLELQAIHGLELEPFSKSLIWEQRSSKEPSEQAAITHASQCTAQAFARVRSQLRAGMTERQVMELLHEALKELGVWPLAFPTIVAFGEHSALPHHQPTDKQLEPEMPVLIDMGGSVDGYAADLTRTIWFGEHPSEQFAQLEAVVQSAYQRVLTLLQQQAARKKQAPLLAKELDHVARTTITKAGFGAQFIHTTGHGLGLEIHEQPSLSSINATPIIEGIAFTVEPGIYLENEFGYRYENTVIMTAAGPQEVTLLGNA